MRSRRNVNLWYFVHLNLQAVRMVYAVSFPRIVVTRGDRAVLPCEFPKFDDSSRLHIVWTFSPESSGTQPFQVLQVIMYQDGRVSRTPWGLRQRVAFVGDPTLRGTISIERVRSADAGLYQCLVVNPALNHQSLIRPMVLSILESPSTPVCSTDGELHLGGSITLTCTSSVGNPPPHYSWWKEDPRGNIPLHPFQTDGGAVVLPNVTVESSGLYICISSNSLGSESCSVLLKLSIFEQPAHTLAVGVAVAMTMAVVLLTLVGLVLYLHGESRKQRWRAGQDVQGPGVPSVGDATPSRAAVKQLTP
ncbi:immunoglobulin superfamily member 11-like [Hemiscyllium ocellatum]|uniref:immunoglobulin superfamily member 11-like n=1 Tax=Hemiscyllium ocellatum TaxID=170820 RepID=UPI002966E9AA|nr:immunoglobulin superfamily member 11-like [Hemiscyllium ocellatum]